MARELIKDNNGQTLGYISEDGHGKSTLQDRNGRTLGTEKDGIVRNNNGQTVCRGKGTLTTLLHHK